MGLAANVLPVCRGTARVGFRRGVGIAFAAAVLPMVLGSVAAAQSQIVFRYENPKLQPALYVMEIREDGTGHFHSETGSTPPEDIAALPAKGQDREIQISKPVTIRLFSIAKQKKFFAYACDSGMRDVAYQGKKTLSYLGPAGQGNCIYNYSKDAQIQWITQELEGVASTLEAGRRLELEHEHARLTLDGELEALAAMVHSGEATELGNIAPVLTSIAQDDAVVQHAQRRARELLVEMADPKSTK